NQAVAQAHRRGDIFNLGYLLLWRGKCQTDRGDLRAAVADLREAVELCAAHGRRAAWPHNIGFLAHALLGQGEASDGPADRRRRRHVASSTGVASQSSYPSTRSSWSGFGSTAPVCASRPEAPSGASRSCAGWARPFGWSCLTIQATCRGAAGPPRAFDCWIGTTRRVGSPPRSSRSRNVGATRRLSAPPWVCSV